MTASDPAATLQALADWYRNLGESYSLALAEHVEGVAKRHTPQWSHECVACTAAADWPCAEVRELLAVVAAAGVKPPPDGYCTCYPEQMGRTADCGIAAHRVAAGITP